MFHPKYKKFKNTLFCIYTTIHRLTSWGCAPKSYLEPIHRNLRKAIRIKINMNASKELFLNLKILD